jgi:hypothetical protein
MPTSAALPTRPERRSDDMTRREFYDLCTSYLIFPLIALENENIKQALRERDDEKVKQILENEF